MVSIDVLDMDAEALQREFLVLRRRADRLLCLLHLVVVALKVAKFSFDETWTGTWRGKSMTPSSQRNC